MLMNYHEMTMNEPRDSSARRKQFLVICTVMAATMGYSALQAGALSPVEIEEGIFPGGEFIYKETKRDYAASGSLQRSIGKHLKMKSREFVDRIYSVYLDDPNDMSGRKQRFASGYLVTDAEGEEKKTILLDYNKDVVPPTEEEILDLGALELWRKLYYKEAILPRVKAATVQYPFTDGFISSLLLGWKILPPLRKYAAEKSGGAAVVISTCSTKEQMCTHYAPLVQSSEFLLGQMDSVSYLAQLEPDPLLVSTKDLQRSVRKYFPYLFFWEDSPKENVEVSDAKDDAKGADEIPQPKDDEKKDVPEPSIEEGKAEVSDPEEGEVSDAKDDAKGADEIPQPKDDEKKDVPEPSIEEGKAGVPEPGEGEAKDEALEPETEGSGKDEL